MTNGAGSGASLFSKYFQVIHEKRQEGKVQHALMDILFIGVCCMLCNCKDWEDTGVWAQEREAWLRQYIPLVNGVLISVLLLQDLLPSIVR